ncbi:MAG: hypothetical protein COA78_22175 [Blastopirellula sp.]|nr:MAG: hypothetical protein COA78_22175 [Blastopirellula sp.]
MTKSKKPQTEPSTPAQAVEAMAKVRETISDRCSSPKADKYTKNLKPVKTGGKIVLKNKPELTKDPTYDEQALRIASLEQDSLRHTKTIELAEGDRVALVGKVGKIKKALATAEDLIAKRDTEIKNLVAENDINFKRLNAVLDRHEEDEEEKNDMNTDHNNLCKKHIILKSKFQYMFVYAIIVTVVVAISIVANVVHLEGLL